jgi:UDP-glucose 4-epimerase
MKYLVTGGCGFIGSHLVERLLHDGHDVVVVDDLSSGKLANLPKHPKLAFVKADIANWFSLVEELPQFRDADGVFHLAAFARIQPSISNPSRCMRINTTGTQNVLEMMRLLKINNIVYSASSSSYGLKNTGALVETMEPDCLTPYSVSKFAGEHYCKTWGSLYGIRNVSLKYFNVFGPRSPLDLGAYCPVIGLFFKQALQGQPMTVVGDGKQSRDFTYVGDVVQANVLAMQNLQSNATANGLTINIGSGASIEIRELAKRVKKVLGSVRKDVEIVHVDARPGEAMHTLADIALAQQVLGWQPQVSLAQALDHLKTHYCDEV